MHYSKLRKSLYYPCPVEHFVDCNEFSDFSSFPSSSSTSATSSTNSVSLRGTTSLTHKVPSIITSPTRPLTSSASISPVDLLSSVPVSPPTPAPSPICFKNGQAISSISSSKESRFIEMRHFFSDLSEYEKQQLLSELLDTCTHPTLSHVLGYVSPRLKKDPFIVLPNEICLRVLSYVSDVKTLTRSAQVSRRWYNLASDESVWKCLCSRYSFDEPPGHVSTRGQSHASSSSFLSSSSPETSLLNSECDEISNYYFGSLYHDERSSSKGSDTTLTRSSRFITYRDHFRQCHSVETAWRTGGKCYQTQITPDYGVVTSLYLTNNYIIVGLDNSKILIFDTSGLLIRTLSGHAMGVWAMVPWDDILVSGGCDRNVRVWNMATGAALHVLRGHTSTVRCLKMADATTAISGSRDATIRIWDISTGVCKQVLIGHHASVRCMENRGDYLVSGSYDSTAKIWSISQGRCLRTLSGHLSQIYAIAFDGKRVVTGSLDTSVRIWNFSDGKCLRVLQGHTSLVGQLELRGDILVSGGSDGSVRVWSLKDFQPIHRLAAHDNSVTSLQFDDNRILSGGSDGRVKVWDLKTGTLIRELSSPTEAIWRAVFEKEKAVVMASKNHKTIMEVWSFSPSDLNDSRGTSPSPSELNYSSPSP